MRILGIDPGTATTGFACIEHSRDQINIIAIGCIETAAGHALAERLHQIATDFEKLIKQTKPDQLAIEKVFFTKNVKTAIAVSHARGVFLSLAEKNGLKTREYTPSQIKLALTGDGAADKLQIQKMLQLICNLNQPPEPDDAADALALAICHSYNLNSALTH